MRMNVYVRWIVWGFNRSNRKLDDRDRQRKRDRQTERRARKTDRNSRKLRERVRKREREAEREVERGFIGTAHLSSIDIDEQTDPFTDFSSFQRQEMGRNLIFVLHPWNSNTKLYSESRNSKLLKSIVYFFLLSLLRRF